MPLTLEALGMTKPQDVPLHAMLPQTQPDDPALPASLAATPQSPPAQDASEGQGQGQGQGQGPRVFKKEQPLDPRWHVHCSECEHQKWSTPTEPPILPPTPTWCVACGRITPCRAQPPAHLPVAPSIYKSVEDALVRDEFRIFLAGGDSGPGVPVPAAHIAYDGAETRAPYAHPLLG